VLSEVCKVIYALDATPESRLRCPTHSDGAASHNVWGPPGFGLEWKACRDPAESGAMHLWGRFEADTAECGADGSGHAALQSRGALSGGVALMSTGVTASTAASLVHDRAHGVLHLCSLHGLWESWVN
jgi:hypothetical protein